MSDKPKGKNETQTKVATAPGAGIMTAARIREETKQAIAALRKTQAEALKTADPRKGVMAQIPLDLHAKWVAFVGKEQTQSDVLEGLIRKAVG